MGSLDTGRHDRDKRAFRSRHGRDHGAENRNIEKNDFELAPFNQEGGLGKVHQVFGSELNKIIEELNGALAA
ncbi:MAG: hypothetical protein JSR62_17665 [Nitrospira sp.]|nr:hypothetical protein [Nitrospira sp.]